MGLYFPNSSVLLRIRWEKQRENTNETFDEVSDIAVQCKRVRVNINDYTQADTFSIEIDYKNFPFDPRTVRAIGATIAMEDTKRIFNDDNSLRTVKIIEKGPDANAIFIGFADEEKISFDDTRRTVTIEGRDYTGLLIDKKYQLGAVSLEKSVDAVISEMLLSNPDTEKITVDNQVQESLPVLAKYWGEKDALSGKRSSVKDETYWDVIQDIVRRAGLIAYIELDKLVIAKPRNIYDKTKAKKFVYGRNLKNLEYSRKIGRKRGFNILVRSLNLNTKEILEAKIPLEATTAWSEATGIANAEVKVKKLKAGGTANAKGSTVEEKEETAPYMSFIVADVSDKNHLIEVGQQVYEEIGRQEIEGSLETKEMATADGDNKEFNLLKLRNGTPIQIYVEQGDMKILSNFRELAGKGDLESRALGPKEKSVVAQYLTNRGWPQKVATLFADKYNQFGNIFYTRAVEFSLDHETGFTCKVDFVNFIETKAGGKRAGE